MSEELGAPPDLGHGLRPGWIGARLTEDDGSIWVLEVVWERRARVNQCRLKVVGKSDNEGNQCRLQAGSGPGVASRSPYIVLRFNEVKIFDKTGTISGGGLDSATDDAVRKLEDNVYLRQVGRLFGKVRDSLRSDLFSKWKGEVELTLPLQEGGQKFVNRKADLEHGYTKIDLRSEDEKRGLQLELWRESGHPDTRTV